MGNLLNTPTPSDTLYTKNGTRQQIAKQTAEESADLFMVMFIYFIFFICIILFILLLSYESDGGKVFRFRDDIPGKRSWWSEFKDWLLLSPAEIRRNQHMCPSTTDTENTCDTDNTTMCTTNNNTNPANDCISDN